jgi:hypothetical protein
MNYEQAVAIRTRQINRQPVDAEEAAEAMRVIKATRVKPQTDESTEDAE